MSFCMKERKNRDTWQARGERSLVSYVVKYVKFLKLSWEFIIQLELIELMGDKTVEPLWLTGTRRGGRWNNNFKVVLSFVSFLYFMFSF